MVAIITTAQKLGTSLCVLLCNKTDSDWAGAARWLKKSAPLQ